MFKALLHFLCAMQETVKAVYFPSRGFLTGLLKLSKLTGTADFLHPLVSGVTVRAALRYLKLLDGNAIMHAHYGIHFTLTIPGLSIHSNHPWTEGLRFCLAFCGASVVRNMWPIKPFNTVTVFKGYTNKIDLT